MAHCYDMGMGVESDSSSCSQREPPEPLFCPDTVEICPDEVTFNACRPQTVPVYKLNSSTFDIYNAMRHIGFPLYPGSFDFYCFVVSLMVDLEFFKAIKQDQHLYRLWSMMWLREDLPRIEHLIEEAHTIEHSDRSTANVAIDILRGAWLRCDIVKFMWALVKEGW